VRKLKLTSRQACKLASLIAALFCLTALDASALTFKPGASYTGEFVTTVPYTGAAANADSLPTATAMRNGTDDGAFTLTVTNMDAGRYMVTGTVPAYSAGDVVQISVSATVSGIAGKAVIDNFMIDTYMPSDVYGITAKDSTVAKDATVMKTASYTAPDNADIATILAAVQSGTYGLNALLTAINSRLAALSYTAPDNADIASIKADVEHATYGLNALLTAVNSRLQASAYTAPDNAGIGAIQADVENVTYGLSAIHDLIPADPASIGDIVGGILSAPVPGANSPGSLGYVVGKCSTGQGNTNVNHNTGGADNLRYTTATGAGISAAIVKAFLKTDYDAGHKTDAFVKGRTFTDINGRWLADLYLDFGYTYTILFYKSGTFGPDTKEVTLP
jgi:hypothetical protein